MSNSANLKIRQRVLAEGKRRNFIANLKSKPPKRGSSGKETEVKGDLGKLKV